MAERAAAFAAQYGRAPGLAVVQVGEDPASSVYVRNKRKSSQEAGIDSFAYDLPAHTGEAQILSLVHALNADPRSTASWCSCRCPRAWTPTASWTRWTRPRTSTDFTR